MTLTPEIPAGRVPAPADPALDPDATVVVRAAPVAAPAPEELITPVPPTASAYAIYDDVLARAGRARIVFGQANAPNQAEVEGFLDEVAGAIDSRLVALGLDAPTADARARLALRGVNADGALILALDASFPSAQVDQAADRLLDRTSARYDKAMSLLESGELAAVAALVNAGAAGASPGAANFWSEEPTYDIAARVTDRMTETVSIFPGVEKGQTL